MVKNPKISIIIPSFNRAHIIGETLASVLAQSSRDWECIIIDDGSTDDTEVVLEKFTTVDNRFQFTNRPLNKPKGANACRNYGILLAKGDYIIFLDSDDILATTCTENRLVEFNKNQDIDYLVFSMGTFNGELFSDNSNPYFNGSEEILIRNFIRNDYPWNITSPIWKKDFLKKIGGFDESLSRYQDVELHIRALLYGGSFKLLEITDCYYRKSEITRKRYSDSELKTTILNSYQLLVKKVLESMTKEQLKLYRNDFKYSYYRIINKYLDGKTRKQIDETEMYIFSKLKVSMIEEFFFFVYKFFNLNYRYKKGYFYINNLFGRYFKRL